MAGVAKTSHVHRTRLIIVDFDKTPLFHLNLIDTTSLCLSCRSQLDTPCRSGQSLRFVWLSELAPFYTKIDEM